MSVSKIISDVLDRHICTRRAYAEEFFFNGYKTGEKHFAFEVEMLEAIKIELLEKIKNHDNGNNKL